MHEALNIFHPLIQKWFSEKVGTPTDIQQKSWPLIAKNEHLLITAPTGSGKTLTAFLWAINQLVNRKWQNKELKVLYISPLKALNNDIQKNLIKPLNELKEYFEKKGECFPEIRTIVRSGDTPQDERQRMIKRPPEILITTPETLNILLTSKKNQMIFTGLKAVILDEIHAIVDTKRGTHLITAVDRLVPISGEFQRIALSATVKPLEKIADFVAGFEMEGFPPECTYKKREVSIVRSSSSKKYDIKVSFPEDAIEDIDEDSNWPILIKDFKKIIANNKSTLFFATSRRATEKITRLINEDEKKELAYSHHGSLSKEIRLTVEQKLKNGELKAIVATNSLELGIDIGELDQVVLVKAPFSISSAIQRIGRAGHSVNQVSKGLLFPTHGRDFLDSAVLAKNIIEQDIEEVSPVECPLDILAQIILSIVNTRVWDIDELFAFLKTSYPYRNLTKNQYSLLIDMLEGKYADTRMRELKPRVSVDRLENTIQAKPHAAFLIYMSGGTIPDRGYYDLRVQDTKAKIGTLDEEFVWERAVGDKFALGAQVWKILRITESDVEVMPTNETQNIIPFWRAEDQNRDFHFSEKIACFLEHANENLDNPSFKEELADNYYMTTRAASKLIEFLKLQKEITNANLPSRHNILLEHFDDPFNKSDSKQVIIHTLWGGKLNRPLAFILASAWEKKFKYPLEIFVNNDCIMLMLPHSFSTKELFSIIKSSDMEELLRQRLEATGFFGAKFRENAGRALLLPKANFKKRMPLWLNRLRSKKLLEAVSKYEDFPILLETWRDCINDEFDLEKLKELLDEIKQEVIKIEETVTTQASPFSGDLIWRQTNKYMYEDDTPDSRKKSDLSQELIKELIFSSHLRPKIKEALLKIFDEKVKRTAEGYAPSSPIDLLDWVKERLVIPEEEWHNLVSAVKRDSGLTENELLEPNKQKLVWLEQDKKSIIALENLGKITKSLGINPQDLKISYITTLDKSEEESIKLQIKKAMKYDQEYELSDFLSQWLTYYGPIEKEKIKRVLSISENTLEATLEVLAESDLIAIDTFGEKSKNTEVCDIENLEILLRMARKSRQPSFKPLPIEELQLFLAEYQGLTSRGESLEDLQQRLEELFGYPALPSAWEEYIFPSRLNLYYTNWLDTLMQLSDLAWIGLEDKKISFTFNNELDLFTEEKNNNGKRLAKLFPNRIGKYSPEDIRAFSNMNIQEIKKELWELAWKNSVSNDTFLAVREGIYNNFFKKNEIKKPERATHSKAFGITAWDLKRSRAGSWYILNNEENEEDLMVLEEINKARVRQLFKRYGIIFRELTAKELPLLQWKNIFKTLRLMELSGEILSGYFFKGIPGLQFISHEAFRILQKELNHNSIYWINACDPISLCGTGIDALKPHLPSRLPSSYMVYHGSKLVVTAKRNGKILEINTPPENPNLQEYLSFFKTLLTRQFNPLKEIIVETINEKPAGKSAYLLALKGRGFKSTYKALKLWKSY